MIENVLQTQSTMSGDLRALERKRERVLKREK